MKTKKITLISILFLSFISIFGCTDDSDLSNLPIDGIISLGSWRVTYFYDKDHEETNDFSGYVFDFKDNGVITATRDGVVTQGTWSISSSSSGNRKFNIFISAADPLDELNDDWIILEESASFIKLKDDNDTHLEELHFSKI